MLLLNVQTMPIIFKVRPFPFHTNTLQYSNLNELHFTTTQVIHNITLTFCFTF